MKTFPNPFVFLTKLRLFLNDQNAPIQDNVGKTMGRQI